MCVMWVLTMATVVFADEPTGNLDSARAKSGG
jgi:ABC-type lipoprotein export system ATPase subunit